jgi:hypothetical protein
VGQKQGWHRPSRANFQAANIRSPLFFICFAVGDPYRIPAPTAPTASTVHVRNRHGWLQLPCPASETVIPDTELEPYKSLDVSAAVDFRLLHYPSARMVRGPWFVVHTFLLIARCSSLVARRSCSRAAWWRRAIAVFLLPRPCQIITPHHRIQ